MTSLDAKDKYEICLAITTDAINKVRIVSRESVGKVLLGFIKDYYNDSKYYADKGEYATALEAISYAHGILDGGILCGVFKIDNYHLKKVDE